MDNGGVFFLAIIAFFFILWLAGGGPSRPISFAGPFITPITNEGETQTGYGPKLEVSSSTLKLPGAAVSVGENNSSAATQPAITTQTQPSTSAPQSTASESADVTITHIAGDNNSPEGYAEISVSADAGQSVDLSEWVLTSSANDESSFIPTGVLVLQLGANNTLQDIVLKPGDKAIVATGISPTDSSFEANECTGYLSSQQSEYNPCVAAHVNDPGFLTGTWYVYLDRNTPLWNASGDTISILDGSGSEVTSVSY